MADAVLLVGTLCLSVWRIWLKLRAQGVGRGALPAWSAYRSDPTPSIVVGGLHHPTVARESGSGETSARIYSFAQQILSWQADRFDRRAAALVLEVKGDFCYTVLGILEEAGGGDDYLEDGLESPWL